VVGEARDDTKIPPGQSRTADFQIKTHVQVFLIIFPLIFKMITVPYIFSFQFFPFSKGLFFNLQAHKFFICIYAVLKLNFFIML
jgi:hypothetical protein